MVFQELLSALFLVSMGAASAAGTPAEFVADTNGIYHVGPNGQRSAVANPKHGELFAESTFQVSPNRAWALTDHVPAKAGPGRIEEVKVLISLRTRQRTDPESFKQRYGVWLGELAEWDPKAPSTIVLEDGTKVQLP